jgi:hypothetical protein
MKKLIVDLVNHFRGNRAANVEAQPVEPKAPEATQPAPIEDNTRWLVKHEGLNRHQRRYIEAVMRRNPRNAKLSYLERKELKRAYVQTPFNDPYYAGNNAVKPAARQAKLERRAAMKAERRRIKAEKMKAAAAFLNDIFRISGLLPPNGFAVPNPIIGLPL